jgi:hypothetical protein
MSINYNLLTNSLSDLYGTIRRMQISLYRTPAKAGLNYYNVRLTQLLGIIDRVSDTLPNSSEEKALQLKALEESLLVLRICAGELEKLAESYREELGNS